jgi:hypothetical protein
MGEWGEWENGRMGEWGNGGMGKWENEVFFAVASGRGDEIVIRIYSQDNLVYFVFRIYSSVCISVVKQNFILAF